MKNEFTSLQLKVLYSILKNYYISLYNTILESNKILYKIQNLPVYFVEKDFNEKLADFCANSSLKLEMKSANLISINKDFLKSKSVSEIISKMQKYKTLNLDKGILSVLQKQEKFMKVCYTQGYVTSHALNTFEQFNNAIKNYYFSASLQAKICLEYIEHEIKLREYETANPDEDVDSENSFDDNDEREF